ncbi:acylneuraminate cytidylyltransferase family protein [Terasakiella sp. A23]|uniref:acylneuraminate cytidylyltransferase family protein n=1 Tax=Terasakiella sp. FCG-A23 TaxID=3080561 RepID=UPI002953B002|nr:acylneuraminate cytidylyltransferase family protein [Terasakiella sp. A23]MDV7340802.1 acylneuraminate cytidylyltransferase family protein [Terasakiella sp. A23]
MSETVAIIPARGGSKGIPGKNIIEICGRPLIEWSIRQALQAQTIDSVWVSSDSEEILEVARKAGAETIVRPADISGDQATSESAWIHALDEIEKTGQSVDWAFGLQATSPVREPHDFDHAFAALKENGWDSLFSSVKIEDYLVWSETEDGGMESQSYDYRSRQRRQEMLQKYLENGSFYIFRPEDIRKYDNRLSGKIGTFAMEKYKSQQIDERGDMEICQSLMKGHGLDR